MIYNNSGYTFALGMRERIRKSLEVGVPAGTIVQAGYLLGLQQQLFEVQSEIDEWEKRPVEKSFSERIGQEPLRK